MKKSTLLFILGNVVILLIPIFLFITLAFKINTGDLIDLKPEKEQENISIIKKIEINGKDKKIHLDIVLDDNLNCIEIDSVDEKYVTYQIIDEKLIFNYDYQKDSIDNFDLESDRYFRSKSKYITVYSNNPIYEIYTKGTILNLSLIDNPKFLNDLSIECISSKLDLSAPYLGNRLRESCHPYVFNYKLDLKFSQRSKIQLKCFGKIKELNLELNKCRGVSYDDFLIYGRKIEIPTFNLNIDKASSFKIDVNDLKDININYIEE